MRILFTFRIKYNVVLRFPLKYTIFIVFKRAQNRAVKHSKEIFIDIVCLIK